MVRATRGIQRSGTLESFLTVTLDIVDTHCK